MPRLTLILKETYVIYQRPPFCLPLRRLSFYFLRCKLHGHIDLSTGVTMTELDEIQSVRELYLRRLLFLCAVIGLPLLVVGIREAVEIGRGPASWLYLALYVPVAVTAIFQKRIPFAVKTLVLVGAFFALAVHNLFHYGYGGTNAGVLLTVCVLMTVLLGQTFGIAAMVGGLASFIAVGAAMVTGAASVSIDLSVVSRQPIAWISASGTFLLLAGTAVLIPGRLQRDLVRSLRSLKDQSEKLATSNAELEREVLERQKAEEALRESEKRFRTLFEYAPDAFYINDLEGRILDGNRAAEALIGRDRREIIGRTFVEAGLVDPNYQSKALHLLQQGVEGLPTGPDELPLKRRDGEAGWIEVVTVPMDMDGKRVILGTARDITARKHAEQEARTLEARLQRAQKMEAMGLMAGGVAHDLNNILSGIVSYPELMLMDPSLPDSARKGLETIQASGTRAAAVVSDLLTVARGVAVGKEPMDLNEAVQQYLETPEHQDLARGNPSTELTLDLAGDLLPIQASPVHVKKVLMNLVTNAFEAVGHGGRVTVSTVNRAADRPMRGYDRVRPGEYAVLTVADSGPGIDSVDLERIFEPFYTKKAMGRSGTGLGLAVVWNILQDHEGYIDVKTGETGTSFDLYFPVTREEAGELETEVPLGDLRGHGERILVVDDEETQRDIASRMLAHLGYKAVTAASGEEAVAYLRERTVDLVILDMIMGSGMNGRETWEAVQKIYPDQKALIASGFTETEDVKKIQAAGAGAYVNKPYTLEKLGRAVKEELGSPGPRSRP